MQPKQTMEISSLIYIPKHGETLNNLIIKSNISGIDIIPIRGKGGVSNLKLTDIKNLSPILIS